MTARNSWGGRVDDHRSAPDDGARIGDGPKDPDGHALAAEIDDPEPNLEKLTSARLLYDLAIAWDVLDLLLAIAAAGKGVAKVNAEWAEREARP